MTQKQLIKSLGSRILSEANDLKRTVSALANDIDVDEKLMQQIIDGECELKDSYEVLRKMGTVYPIDISDLFLLKDDCDNGIKLMKRYESKLSSRIFDRKEYSWHK